MSAIEVADLVKCFGTVRAVDGISFRVAPGRTVALLGGNGAGKTTTLAMILGLVTPDSGTIRVFGRDLARARYQLLTLMNFQSPYVDLPRRLTVRQNLGVYARLYGLANPRPRIEELAADLDLLSLLDRPFGQLSAGQRTRAGLAKALINSPRLLLLDEPTASLDPDTADWVRGYLEQYRRTRQATLLLASHNMGEVERLCDEVHMMKGGKIVDRGTPRALIDAYGRRTLEEVFLDIARDRRAGAAAQ
jgi:ABC-2 type transport system ATP-binding protein